MMVAKNARQRWTGVFLCLCFLLAPHVQGSQGIQSARSSCPAERPLQWSLLGTVVDGDTLRLSDGSKLRLVAVNAPELGRQGRPDQPLAQAAKHAVEQFFAGDRRVGWHAGVQTKDHYGRYLGYVYRGDGASLSAYLLENGLAWRIAIPPNLRYQPCLQRAEQLAHSAGKGVWAVPAYGVKPSRELTESDAGFARVAGTVSRVTETKRGWWVDLPGLSLYVSKQHRAAFAENTPERWLQREVTASGWIINRGDAATVRQNGYAPMMMRVSHPSMVAVAPKR